MAEEHLEFSTPPLTREAKRPAADAGDEGYAKALAPRHVGMIAIGGAIGTGLLLGAGGKLLVAGPALALSYAIAGVFAYLVVRALGELTLHRPSSGSFVSYAREFLGESGAYVAGWMYVLNWSTTGMADSTAVALYMHYWGAFTAVPQWLLALCALVIVLTVNLVSVRLFGEIEFWFAIIKVVAILSFLLIGVWLLGTGHKVGGSTPGLGLIRAQRRLLRARRAAGLLGSAKRRIRVCGCGDGRHHRGRDEGAGEDRAARRALGDLAHRTVLYLQRAPAGAAAALEPVLRVAEPVRHGPVEDRHPRHRRHHEPGRAHRRDVQPELGLLQHRPGAALDGAAGSAPRFTGLMNARHVPYGGVLLTSGIATLGVGLNAWLPGQAFEIVVNFAALGVVSTWVMIMLCHLVFVRRTRASTPPADRLARPNRSFRLKGWPWVNVLTIAFLAAVVADMGVDGGTTGAWTIAALPVIAAVLGGRLGGVTPSARSLRSWVRPTSSP
jgi:L-asparagine permease